jgi:hypothetical protein
MKTRFLIYLLLILLLLWLFKPARVWSEAKRMWSQRELMVRTLVVLIVLYFVYGLYSLYQQGWFAR